MIQFVQELYGPFFSLQNWVNVLDSAEDWSIILSIIILECLLSVDNAVVLAAQTQTLPTKRQQEGALLWGLWGSYILRFIMIGLGTFMIHMWEVKLLGAMYLMYLVVDFFRKYHHPDTTQAKKKTKQGTFWSVVVQMVFMDAIFSVDSILAALAVSVNPIIVLIGGLVGILVMRGVAEIIVNLMARIPELEPMAYCLIAFIAVKLFLTIPQIGIEIPSGVFVIVVIALILITLAIHFYREGQLKKTK